MRIAINKDSKIVALWLNSQENLQMNVPINIKNEIEEYKQKKYKVCIYQSGNEDLKKNLLNLVINNAENI